MRTSIGKFEIIRLLGQGSMGEVYLAEDPGLGREVAIKTILRGNDFGGESVQRFEREAKAMAALNHPHIVTLFDFGQDDGISFLVMEYLPGEDLATLIDRREARPDLLEALAQACEGLAYAHERGVVHRDVKPGNIRVVRRGGRVHAKLMDFGIAAVDRSDLTVQGSWMGTISYMAPEYLDTGKVVPACDQFAAGVILYEILSGGRKPFPGETTTGVLNAILRLAPVPLDPDDLRELPAALPGVMAKALAKDPAGRYASLGELAAAIRAAAAGAPAPVREEAPGRVLVVGRGPRATCLSLRVALRQAEPAATILVLPGVYREAILVDKDITIRGEGDPEGVVLPDGVTVAGPACLTLSGARLGSGSGPALRLLVGARAKAVDVCFEEAPAGGVELGPGAGASFLRCRFNGNGSAGLVALEASQASLDDCELAGNQDAGLHACGSAKVRLLACRLVANQGLGASAVDAAELALERCELARNEGPGLLLERGGTGRLVRCMVTGGRSLGVLCGPGSALTLEECQVAGNALGGMVLTQAIRASALGPGNRISDSIRETGDGLPGQANGAS